MIGHVAWNPKGGNSYTEKLRSVAFTDKSVSFDYGDDDDVVSVRLEDNGEGQYVGTDRYNYRYRAVRSEDEFTLTIVGDYCGNWVGDFEITIYKDTE